MIATNCDVKLLHELDETGLRSLLNSNFCTLDYNGEGRQAPWGMKLFSRICLQSVNVFEDESSRFHSACRTRRHIMQDEIDDFLVMVPTAGVSSIAQYGIRRDCTPGSFRILSMAVPFAGSHFASSGQEVVSKISARIPGASLRKLVPRIDEISNVPVPLKSGTGKIMVSMLKLALAEGNALSTPQAENFGNTLIHSIANAIHDIPEFDALFKKPRPTTAEKIRETAKDYILRNLSNPRLGSKAVAAYCQISERYLRSVFEDSPLKVGELIREARLLECQSQLRDPSFANHSVAGIAAKWGFTDSTSFNRSYKSKFGIAPGKERDHTRVRLAANT